MFAYIQIYIYVCLATGRQPGGFSDNSDGKSNITFWILRGGERGPGREGSPCTPPPLRSRFVYRIFHHNFPKNCRVAIQWPDVSIPMISDSFFPSWCRFHRFHLDRQTYINTFTNMYKYIQKYTFTYIHTYIHVVLQLIATHNVSLSECYWR